MQIMPILRLIEPVARLSISCHLFYLFHNDWVIVSKGHTQQRMKTDNNNNNNYSNTVNSLF